VGEAARSGDIKQSTRERRSAQENPSASTSPPSGWLHRRDAGASTKRSRTKKIGAVSDQVKDQARDAAQTAVEPERTRSGRVEAGKETGQSTSKRPSDCSRSAADKEQSLFRNEAARDEHYRAAHITPLGRQESDDSRHRPAVTGKPVSSALPTVPEDLGGGVDGRAHALDPSSSSRHLQRLGRGASPYYGVCRFYRPDRACLDPRVIGKAVTGKRC